LALPFNKSELLLWRVTLLLTAKQAELKDKQSKVEMVRLKLIGNCSIIATPQINKVENKKTTF
jgi:hypothetical protein